ncbi:hypothetical protein BU25DRAFT_134710 [Macroventuria anomochaeta]|uniref:Uncharacterized protein n=1 Tax=Macroventuria anomochaeta TaxID=301207 RepID=A0ACB6RS65_9PLEO|nr:uncharacterized protein BU25DRAFT_134710 [Macroventuria anomochaeta]KAF2624810.1 hypothetical protein BU25DRAFT_134710 [Macroventuria anomochaeta]
MLHPIAKTTLDWQQCVRNSSLSLPEVRVAIPDMSADALLHPRAAVAKETPCAAGIMSVSAAVVVVVVVVDMVGCLTCSHRQPNCVHTRASRHIRTAGQDA